ncbi:DNA topoisomerase IV subunit B [Magnetospira sp. QH-2]|uniref:DNA topoisomerase IV subunit B n=1 Tax=Magnetospira sp. (strain QH-2) TaxID=1288970 RepID=UPI0003E80B7A|nr:DNA topoisomerase IV subunit B [Magnetospira sp. QH-2]CCQ73719.1 DNA topoisomerase IV, subunit B [Magnetospira sp. QH-2]
MNDLFQADGATTGGYSAKDIEVLEGLEPVRRRPGMYIGGTDERALHHLVAEVLDNSMDEAVAGHASRIELELGVDNRVTVRDNGRGIPVDKHPKMREKSALEVILTTLHSGGKFGGKAYETSGGLHGVGISVVNALAEKLEVEVARDRELWAQSYERGKPLTKLRNMGATQNRRGTTVIFQPDTQIFGHRLHFKPSILYKLVRSKAYLFRGVEIRWSCDPSLLKEEDKTPQQATLHFPGGLSDFLAASLDGRAMVTPTPFAGTAQFPDNAGKMEWAVAWPEDDEAFFNSYCNTVPTPQGGTHETGLRTALLRGLKAHGELVNNRQAAKMTADDLVGGACIMLSVFIRDPQFQGQTKEKLSTAEASRLVENAVRDHFDHWLSGDPDGAKALLERIVDRANSRLRKKQDKEMKRASATKRLRLPGKLADCSRSIQQGTELFIVEGDSAGGSAKQARRRDTQAVLPLRGKILNVASASADKLRGNQELSDLQEALGCGTRDNYSEEALRYEKIIIMTDADVDGAHIASLLMTYFFREMPKLIETGHLFIALPPLFRIAQGGKVFYARDEAHKEELMAKEFSGRGKIEVSRFKGLGEMPPAQLKETTMDPASRILLKVSVPMGHSEDEIEEAKETASLVEQLMGRKPEARMAFIQDQAKFVEDLDV